MVWFLQRIVLALMALVCEAVPAAANPDVERVAAVVAQVKPAVVQIISVRPPPQPGAQDDADGAKAASTAGPVTAIGSGFIISPEGFVATNKHVV